MHQPAITFGEPSNMLHILGPPSRGPIPDSVVTKECNMLNNQSVRISKRAKRITLQRYLLAKAIYFMEDFSLQDLACLFENQLWLEDKVHKDNQFAENFGKDLESLSIILKQINFRMEFTERSLRRFSIKLKQELEGFYLPKRNYQQTAKLYSGFYTLVQNSPLGKLTSSLPETSRIGKGYRDKGSARNPAKDGSPKWQEVAAHHGPLYHKGVKSETNENVNRDKEDEEQSTSSREPGKRLSFYNYLRGIPEEAQGSNSQEIGSSS